MAGAVAAGAAWEGRGPPGGRVVLAREADFALGPLQVVPSRRVVRTADGREDVLEPRVMQVLVALHRAGGAIVGRDDLVQACWEGRIVGDDAINRVISRVRRVQETIGDGVFAIETVTRVGYRLRSLGGGADAQASEASPSSAAQEVAARSTPQSFSSELGGWSRRTIVRIAGAGLTAIALPAAWSFGERTRWFGLAGHRPTSEARRFYDEGERAQYHSLTATSELAEGYFRQAAQADPDWPDAWGSLAMSYRHMLDGETNTSQWRLVERTRSAARRALELDPDNAEALVALALVRSPFRRWREAERTYLALLERFPRAFILRGHLARLLRDVGRYAAALEHTAIIVRQQPEIIMPAFFHAQTLWGLGRVHEAETAYKSLIGHWPKHIVAWNAYTAFLTYSGRPGDAAVFAADRETRPSSIPDRVLDRRMYEARAIATRLPADIQRARESFETLERRSLGTSPGVVPIAFLLPFYVACGDLDTAFAHIEGFYFGRGRFGSPSTRRIGPLTRRESDILFMPSTVPLRRRPQFGPILRELGIMEYWRLTGTGREVPW